MEKEQQHNINSTKTSTAIVKWKESMKKDGIRIGIGIILCYIVLQAVFFKDSLFLVAGTTISLYYVFVIPSFPLTYIFFSSRSFIERILLSTVLGIAFVTISNYYLSLFLLPITSLNNTVPAIIFILSLAITFFVKKKGGEKRAG